MSLGLITTAARLGFPLVFVIGDDWLCYGGWADAWLKWCHLRPRSPGDPAALAHAVRHLAQSQDLRRRLTASTTSTYYR